MLVNTITGERVSFENIKSGELVDSNGVTWKRNPVFDIQKPYGAAYTETEGNGLTVRLTKDEVKRIIKGTQAIRTPITVEEMRVSTLKLSTMSQQVVDRWSDQQLREILIEAEEKRQNPGELLLTKVNDALEELEELALEKELTYKQKHTREATEGPSVALETQGTPKNTPRRRKQEGGLSVVLENKSILLTSKQLEFMERLSECPDWKEHGVAGKYIASEYAQELSDTMTPMSVGAVLTTLREKELLHTEKRRVGAIKCCVFQLTELGVRVYNKLAGKEG